MSEALSARLKELVREFSNKRLLVVGDVGIDRYVTGDVERISPEAPVPIVLVSQEVHKLGLAANVADNLKALGAETELVGVIGKDRFAAELRVLLKKEKVSDQALVADSERRTIVKERIVSESQQLLRIDYESQAQVSPAIEKKILLAVRKALRKKPMKPGRGGKRAKGDLSVDGVIIQDYAKGMLSKRLVKEIVREAQESGKPVFMDPNMKTPLEFYRGATFMTPNTKEAERLAEIQIRDSRSLRQAGTRLLEATDAPYVVITRGKDGMAIFKKDQAKPELIPTYAREVYDVSGAGDTVITIMALAFVSGASIEEAAILGNLGAGVVVGKRGTAVCTPKELEHALGLLKA
jgi:bifunctional ADP-heptose synthase (sugar kinase/adenylyltransferase)